MRWEPAHGGYALRVPLGFAGLVYPLTGGRWLAEVFGCDYAGNLPNIDSAKRFVVSNIQHGTPKVIQSDEQI